MEAEPLSSLLDLLARMDALAPGRTKVGSLPLNASEYRLLQLVVRQPGLGVKQIGSALQVTRSTLCDQIHRLQSRGWLQVEPDRRDRRRKKIAATPAGEQLICLVEENRRRLIQHGLDHLAPCEQSQLLSLLERFFSPDP